MTQEDITYDAVQTTEELERLTLETVSGLGNLITCFLSEFERGKETAEIDKVLKALRTHPGSGGHHPAARRGDTFRKRITKTSRLGNENYQIRLDIP